MYSQIGSHPVAPTIGTVHHSEIVAATIIRTCHQILDSGSLCRAAAVGSSRYCRAHRLLTNRRRKIARARRRIPPVTLPELVDLRAIELGAARVREAVRSNRIDSQTGRVMLWALQLQQHIMSLQRKSPAQFSPLGRPSACTNLSP